jgi:nucleoside-diphosphate-sugar epimerase
MNILITGGTGFIGRAALRALINKNHLITIISRRKININLEGVSKIIVGDISKINTSKGLHKLIKKTLDSTDVVLHMAGLAHVSCSLHENRVINRDATLSLARIALTSGVNRFVFLSSIGVNGNQNNRPFTEKDKPNPREYYAISKYEAEQGLLDLSKESNMDTVIIRPPLVYGPGAPGNFNILMKWIYMGFPLPFGLIINNKRSFVALENLLSFIVLCLDYKSTPLARNQVFLISDGEDVSTSQLLSKISKSVKSKTILLPIPVFFLKFILKLIGKKDAGDRLFNSLQVDNSKARKLLNWSPIVTMDQQLKINQRLSDEKNI